VAVSEWEPATDAEAAMLDALRIGDQEHYFRLLARTELILPVAAEALAGRAPVGWGTWTAESRTHVLAFTSPEALSACLAEHAGTFRKVPFHELAADWPDLEWWLAVNPGLPVEAYLPAWFVAQISRGDVRLPGRTLGARARMDQATGLRSEGAARGGSPPAREPAGNGSLLPSSGRSLSRRAELLSRGTFPRRGDGPAGADDAPRRGADLPGHGADVPGRAVDASGRTADVPVRGGDAPGRDVPVRGGDAPGRAADVTRRGDLAPAEGDFAPGRGDFAPGRPEDAPHRWGDAPRRGAFAPGRPEEARRRLEDETRHLGDETRHLEDETRRLGDETRRLADGPGRPDEARPRPDAAPRPAEAAPGGQAAQAEAAAGGQAAPAESTATPNGSLAAAGGFRADHDPSAADGDFPTVDTAQPPEATDYAASGYGGSAYEGSVYDGSGYGGSTYGGSGSGHGRAAHAEPSQSEAAHAEPPQSRAAQAEPPQSRAAHAEPPQSGAGLAEPDHAGRTGAAYRPSEHAEAVRGRAPGPITGAYPALRGTRPPTQEYDFTPANRVEENLLDAAGEGSTDSFLSTLLLARVLVPGPQSDAIANIEQWRTEQIEDQPYVVVFTSPEMLARHLSEGFPATWIKFTQLIHAWPSPALSFAVNPGTPIGATLPGEHIVALASWADEVGLTDEQPEPEPAAAAEPARRSTPPPPSAGPVVMQKTISAQQVPFYLERGYDRVSGFVHRASEVANLRTPGELYTALGLNYSDSPFKPDDAEVYVLRWSAHRGNLYRIPYGGQHEAAMHAMQGWVIERPPFRGNGFAPSESRDVIAEFKVDSVRLPHGAELWRVDREGNEKLIAMFDADGPRWQRVGDA
jgi:hypothetical protein